MSLNTGDLLTQQLLLSPVISPGKKRKKKEMEGAKEGDSLLEIKAKSIKREMPTNEAKEANEAAFRWENHYRQRRQTNSH